jgi:pimeloyl-ACP methyl ester carboxylesterase
MRHIGVNVITWTSKHWRAAVVLATLLLSVGFPPARADDGGPKKDIAGYWLGSLKLGAIEMRLGFQIKRKDDDTLTATGDSIDQGTAGLPVETVTFVGNTLTLKMPDMYAVYTGCLQPDGDTIKGELTKGAKMPLELKRQDKPFTPDQPQLPKKACPYLEEEVTFRSKADGVMLAGTFTKPKSEGPFVTAILITGSGPQDRDESVMGHKPFRVLADHLTRKGIAVLRYDDRGIAKSTGDFQASTTRDFADDTAGAVAYLKARKDVGIIGLIGHSEGGMIAPMVAGDRSDVSFIVLLAAPGTPGDTIVVTQGTLTSRAMESDDKAIARQESIQRKLFALIKDGADEPKLQSAMPEDLSAAEKAAVHAQMPLLTSPWFKYFLNYDPRPTLGRVRCPVLALNGGKDLQVSAKENLSEIERAVKAGGNVDVTVKELPGLNHLFQQAQTGLPGEYEKLDTTFTPAVLELIADWIVTRTGS